MLLSMLLTHLTETGFKNQRLLLVQCSVLVYFVNEVMHCISYSSCIFLSPCLIVKSTFSIICDITYLVSVSFGMKEDFWS